MPFSSQARQRLGNLLLDGTRRCAEKIVELSGHPWESKQAALSQGSGTIPPEYLLKASQDDHFGTFFTFRGGACLVVYHRRAGLLLADRMTKDAPAEIETLYKLEPQVLSEVSNILTSALLKPLSAACARGLILSAPMPMTGRRQELLARAIRAIPDPSSYPLRGYVRLISPKFSTDCVLVLFFGSELIEAVSRSAA